MSSVAADAALRQTSNAARISVRHLTTWHIWQALPLALSLSHLPLSLPLPLSVSHSPGSPWHSPALCKLFTTFVAFLSFSHVQRAKRERKRGKGNPCRGGRGRQSCFKSSCLCAVCRKHYNFMQLSLRRLRFPWGFFLYFSATQNYIMHSFFLSKRRQTIKERVRGRGRERGIITWTAFCAA